MDFLAILGCNKVCIIHKEAPWYYHYVHFGMTVIKVLYFIPNSRKSNSKQRQIFIVWFRCIVSAIIYYLVHFWYTVFGETVCISYSVICDILFDGAAASGIGVQRPALTLIDCIDWVVIFLRAKAPTAFIASYHRNSVRPSACPSVRPSVTCVDQSKALQARITKFSPSAAWNYR